MASKKAKYYQRPDGLYEAIRVIDGKRKAFRGHSPKEVEQKMIAYQGAIERGRSFREIAEEWEELHFPTLAPNTLKGYRPACRRAKEHFGNTSISQIKAPDIKKFISAFARTGPGQTSRAQKTVANQLLVVSLVMGYAAENGEIEFNPCANVSIPRDLSKDRREAASPEDEAKVKASADVWLLPYLILYTGLRKGEALALTYDDIDHKNGVIRVTKSVYHESTSPKIKSPKTAAGIREMPILAPLRSKLPKRGNGYIFSTDGGKTPLKHDVYNTMWERYAKETGIQCTAHQLRHSYATMLFECGIDVKDAQDLLGHATASMTQDIYTHIRDDHRKKTAQLLDKKLSKKEKSCVDSVSLSLQNHSSESEISAS